MIPLKNIYFIIIIIFIQSLQIVPGEPQDFKVVKVTSTSIELEWKPPRKEDQSSSNVKGYEIHYFKVNPSQVSSNSNEFKSSSNGGGETLVFKRKTNDIKRLKYTLSDLEPGSLYKIQIFAYNMKGDGQRSSPLLVNTLEEGPNKPESIQSEIDNEYLTIKWHPPFSSATNDPSTQQPQQVGGYRIYFNNEKYEVDANTNLIKFQRPKWEYDNNYEFKISARSRNGSTYGHEAIYRISTHTTQSKLTISFEKLTSSSVLVKWNEIKFTSKSNNMRINVHYLFQYWLKSESANVIQFDKVNTTELQLSGLKANSDYMVQIAAFGTPQQPGLGIMSTEATVKHFRTLISDIEAPANLQVIRYEPDKINIKWDPVVMIDPDTMKLKSPVSLIKGYRIYYKESVFGDDYNYDSSGVDSSSEEWKMYEQLGEKNTDISLTDLNTNKDYAFKIVAFDYSNNEGPESQIQIAYRITNGNGNGNENYIQNRNLNSNENDQSENQSGEQQQQQKIGMPRDLEIIELTSTSVKFSWMPPSSSSTTNNKNNKNKITNFLISYIDRPKNYKETNGTTVSYQKGIAMLVRVPSRDDPTIKIMWLVSGLAPFTEYDFNISAQMGAETHQSGPPIQKRIKTRRDRPARVERPTILDVYTDNTVLLNTGNASERNGPIAKYWLVVNPIHSPDQLGKSSQQHPPQQQQQQTQQFQNYETRERDISNLLRYSIYNTTISNDTSYIAAEFDADNWPQRFILGDGNKYGRFINRRLIRNIDYKTYIIAFTNDDSLQSDQSQQQQVQQLTKQEKINQNLLGLGDLLNKQSSINQLINEGDLFTTSYQSDIFNTRNFIELANQQHHHQNAIRNSLGLGVGDFHNILWVAGAVASIIFLFIIIVVLTLHVMHKKSKLTQNLATASTAQSSRGVMSAVGIGNGASSRPPPVTNSATSSTTTTTNILSHHVKAMDTSVSLGKNGGSGTMVTTTTTLTKQSNKNNNNNNLAALSGSGGGGPTTTTTTTNTSSASSSSSSSTTASPTTALLSCNITNNNNNSNNNSNNTNENILLQQQQNLNNSNNLLLLTNGLLTTASPLRGVQIQDSNSMYSSSLELQTQKLLQQQMMQQQQIMIMNQSANSFNLNGNGTLTRNQQQQQQNQYNFMLMNQQQQMMNHNTLNMNSIYDPIEFRRMNYLTSAMQSHPPIHIEDLFQYIERLKAQNNLKFSLEYESIEPGQQFTWHHSILDSNRLKNRYANVIAYDHSRVVLSKLPPNAFISNNNNLNNMKSNTLSNNNSTGYYQTLNSNSNNNTYSTLNSKMQLQLQLQLQANNSNLDSNNQNEYQMTKNIILPPPPPPPPQIDISQLSTNTSLSQISPNSMSNHSDYINANYIDGFRKRSCYIATQGPLPGTMGDFWRMIWEQKSCTIVMMTKLEERNRLKCDQYWPTKGSECYDNIMQVTLVDHTELATYSIRTFIIAPINIYAQQQQQSNQIEMRREVKHFQYTAWPDHGVPDHPTPFLMFVRRVRLSNPLDSGPIVVHCSAGVGRTGCYLTIDTMLERLRYLANDTTNQDKTIDIYGYVTCMRSQRNYMIQTEEQYIFCYDATLEASQSGQTEIPTRMLYQHLQRLLQITSDDPNLMLTEMELEYKRLSNIKAPQSKFQSANLPANKFKNRLVNILPYEATRVVLLSLPNAIESSGCDYINANFIDGYRYKRAYIATQAPLVETIDDFWRMLWEHNSTIIVMLTKLREMGREKCAQYWPNDRSIRYQYFVVDPIAEYNMTQYILREFKVTDARDGQSRTIRQFQFVDWPEQGVPKSGESIVELIGQVHKTKEQFGQTGPITVHCSAGVGRTGVFITLSIVLERMRYESIIDVFNTVKVLRTQRPAMVQTEDQYQFCYRAALEYLGSFGDSYE